MFTWLCWKDLHNCDIIYCDPNSYENNGICYDLIDGLMCESVPGYADMNCATNTIILMTSILILVGITALCNI